MGKNDDDTSCFPDDGFENDLDKVCNELSNNAIDNIDVINDDVSNNSVFEAHNDHLYSISQEKRLKICTINVCGLKSKLLYPEFDDFLDKYDIICITESKLDRFDSINLDNFSIITNNRSIFKSKSGGIALLYKNSLSSSIRFLVKSDGILLASLSKDICGFPVLFVCVYCPPEGSVYANDDIFTELEQIILDNMMVKRFVFWVI